MLFAEAMARLAKKDVVSPSLLARIDPTKKTSSDFSLGMSEWTESEDSGKENQPHSNDDFKQTAKKKTRFQKQQTKKKQDKLRFAESVSSSELHVATMTKAVVPKNTQKNTGWALRNFSEWRKEREKRCIGEKCRPGLFDSPPWDVAELNQWLCLYVLETRRTDGKKVSYNLNI